MNKYFVRWGTETEEKYFCEEFLDFDEAKNYVEELISENIYEHIEIYIPETDEIYIY